MSAIAFQSTKALHEELRQDLSPGALPQIENLLAACDRFVPPLLLRMIGARSVEQVRPGQHAQAMVHVLFVDILGYTTLTEDQTPADSFRFINDYLGMMEPVVQRNGGVVDKFIGDAIMALFPGDADDAVQCAVELAAALATFNSRRAGARQSPIGIGIGINSGTVQIGAVGTRQRLQTTVIGDAVNLAARLEATTRDYRAQILISESVLYAMNGPQPAMSRFIDRIRVKGKLRPVSIYEIVTRQDPAYASKVESRTQFERAVAYYHTRHVDEALALFGPLCAGSRDDGPAHTYLARCEQFLRDGTHHGTGEISTGVEWRHDYDIGVDEIDQQHQEWCKRLGELLDRLHSGRQDGVAELFEYLRDYIHWHFTEEEALMDERAYPARAEHKLEHAHYAQALERFRMELLDGGREPLLVNFRANLFLVDWFVNHTTGTDRELGRFLARRTSTRSASNGIGPNARAVAPQTRCGA